MKLKKEERGFFISYASLDYDDKVTKNTEETIEKIREKISQGKILFDSEEDISFSTPDNLNLSLYKLHISLSPEEYLNHQDTISNLLLSHIEKGTIDCFKHANYPIIEKKLAQIEKLIPFVKQAIKDDYEKDSTWEKNFLSALKDYYEDENPHLPLKRQLYGIENELNKTKNELERFLKGDQFTIYIPKGYDENKILELCKDINECIPPGCKPGDTSDVSSTLGEYMSLRQEYLMNDFNQINEAGFFSAENLKRINAVNIDPNNKEEQERRLQVKEEQENSPLYHTLQSGLEPKFSIGNF